MINWPLVCGLKKAKYKRQEIGDAFIPLKSIGVFIPVFFNGKSCAFPRDKRATLSMSSVGQSRNGKWRLNGQKNSESLEDRPNCGCPRQTKLCTILKIVPFCSSRTICLWCILTHIREKSIMMEKLVNVNISEDVLFWTRNWCSKSWMIVHLSKKDPECETIMNLWQFVTNWIFWF